MRILFVTASRIGDAVLSTALLAHLIERYPGARLTIACGPAAAPLFEAVPGLEQLIALPKRRWGGHWLLLWAATVGTRWDLVVDLRASALAWMLWVRERRVFHYNHALGHRLRQLAALFALDPPPSPRLWTAPRQDEAAARLIPGDAPVLALGPTANWPRKTWPAERFSELAQRLTGPGGILPDARVAVFGGPGEEGAARPVLDSLSSDRRIDLVGRVDLLTAYACLRRCALFIGNDSGLMHLAAAAEIPTLGLFGPSKEQLYAPWGPRAVALRTPERYDDLVGGPGYDRFAPQSLMLGLTVNSVASAAEDLWARAGRTGDP